MITNGIRCDFHSGDVEANAPQIDIQAAGYLDEVVGGTAAQLGVAAIGVSEATVIFRGIGGCVEIPAVYLVDYTAGQQVIEEIVRCACVGEELRGTVVLRERARQIPVDGESIGDRISVRDARYRCSARPVVDAGYLAGEGITHECRIGGGGKPHQAD